MLALTAAAASLLAIGWVASESSYEASLLANLGTTLLLAVPLLLLERVLEKRVTEVEASTERSLGGLDKRIQDVQESVSDVTTRLDEVDKRASEAIDARRSRDVENAVAPADAITENPSLRAS